MSGGEERRITGNCKGLHQSEGLLLTSSTVGALIALDSVPGVWAFLPPAQPLTSHDLTSCLGLAVIGSSHE